jgi:8-oxo-dGTP pyrophosphatase MutT (NUDIX family)
MRVMLGTVRTHDESFELNTAAHLAMLEDASAAGCDLVVFPQFSLTGAIDPRSQPAGALAVDSGPVAELLDATARTGVGAIFGIAERSRDRFFITQLYAHGGSIHGICRRHHLGTGEEGFTPGEPGAVFRLGQARFAIALCADGARRARELDVWVFMIGRTASVVADRPPSPVTLIDPYGRAVARLERSSKDPLVVDVPISITVEPVREAVRVLVIDEVGRALLVRFEDRATGLSWWCPPGGGLEAGEDHRAAAQRELAEELGRDDLVLGAFVGHRTLTFCFNSVWVTQRERWIVARTGAFSVSPERLALLEQESVREVRWWAPEELESSGVLTAPTGLAALVAETVSGVDFDPRRDLSQ